MSKMDNLRAMREARYEAAAARSPKAAAQQTGTTKPTPTGTTKTATRVATPVPAAPTPTDAPTDGPTDTGPADTGPTDTGPAAAPEDARCGHRAISGRTCTREAGHAAKSHRYA